MNDELFLVTGASGKLGLSFIEELKKKGKKVIGIARKDFNIEDTPIFNADLIDKDQILNIFKNFDFSKFSTINLIHPVGKFKFETSPDDITDYDNDGLDDEVYMTNVITLKNTLQYLLSELHNNQYVNVCTFASVSDKHNIPFWQSYTKSKNIIRHYLKELSKNNYIRALVVNVSTVDTGNENLLRPNADKEYWLKPEEIVSPTLKELSNLSCYKEVDVFKINPNFEKGYYLDLEAILKKWGEEMKKIEGENVKSGPSAGIKIR